MINVSGPPEEWAGDVARLMVGQGRPDADVQRFFEVVFTRGQSSS